MYQTCLITSNQHDSGLKGRDIASLLTQNKQSTWILRSNVKDIETDYTNILIGKAHVPSHVATALQTSAPKNNREYKMFKVKQLTSTQNTKRFNEVYSRRG